jgi:hypothetical protein
VSELTERRSTYRSSLDHDAEGDRLFAGTPRTLDDRTVERERERKREREKERERGLTRILPENRRRRDASITSRADASAAGFTGQICRVNRNLHIQVAMSERNVSTAVTADIATSVIGSAALDGTNRMQLYRCNNRRSSAARKELIGSEHDDGARVARAQYLALLVTSLDPWILPRCTTTTT